jgi:hypothetical protein
MKAAVLLAVAIVIFSTIPVMAHPKQDAAAVNAEHPRVKARSGASLQPSPGWVAVPGFADDAKMKPVSAQLVSEVDSSSARAGDTVIAQTDQDVAILDGTVIPRGSRLIGRIWGVQALGGERAVSSVSITFDRAVLEGGRSLAIRSVIWSVAPPDGVAAETSAGRRETSIPAVRLAYQAPGMTSTTVLAPASDVRLDSGTQITLGLWTDTSR